MNGYEILALDSEIFGFGVAKLLPATLTAGELERILSRLRAEQVRLVFWASDPKDEASQRAARLSQGFLADRKATFVIDLAAAGPGPAATAWECREYTDGCCCEDLEKLALLVGRNSRFGADPRMPVEGYGELYKRWIRNSVSGEAAEAVLVVRQSGRIVGMATVGAKGGRGFIGLFAVDPGMREKRVGASLVHAAQEWTRRRGLPVAQVVTQKDNVAACRLYEKCGYMIERVEHFYHFWI